MTKETKSTYRIRNWKEYNTSLIQRGSITLWFSEDAIANWHKPDTSRKRGRPKIYSDDAILCFLLIRTVYHLPLRAAQGFLLALIRLLNIDISVPGYTQVSRRSKTLGKKLTKLSKQRPVDIVFDSTGLKVFGEGEWKVRKHGASKRRTWRKLHIGIDPDSQEIIVGTLTKNGAGCGDGEVAQKLLKRLPSSVDRIFGDGAYDGIEFRQDVEQLNAELVVPPPRDAVVHKNSKDSAMIKRNNAVLEIAGLGGSGDGRALWKKLKRYHRRSLGETAMYRIKQITGGGLRSRDEGAQYTEAIIKCLVVNTMTRAGMPKGVWEAAA